MTLVFSCIITVYCSSCVFIASMFHVLSLLAILCRSLCFFDVRLSHLNKYDLLTYLHREQ